MQKEREKLKIFSVLFKKIKSIFCFSQSEHKFDLFIRGHHLPLSFELNKVSFAGARRLGGIVRA